MALPCLAQLDVGALLDELPPELRAKVEEDTRDRRRGLADDQCLRVEWKVSGSDAVLHPGGDITILVRMYGRDLQDADGHFMLRAIRDGVAALGVRTTNAYRAPLQRREPFSPLIGMYVVTRWRQGRVNSGPRNRGLTSREAVELMGPVVDAFSAYTDRGVSEEEPYVHDETTTEWSRAVRLCRIRRGERGFLGRVVAKSLVVE